MKPAEYYINYLLLVILADDKVREEETTFLDNAMELLEYEDLDREKIKKVLKKETQLNKEEIIQFVVNKFSKNLFTVLIRDAYIMAYIDGFLSLEEVELIDSTLKLRGYSEEECRAIQAWGETQIKMLELGRKIF